MLQNIAPHVYNNVYSLQESTDADYLLLWQEGKFLLRQTDEDLLIPTLGELRRQPALGKLIAAQRQEINYLFQLDGDSYYCLAVAENKVADAVAAAAADTASTVAAGSVADAAAADTDSVGSAYIWLSARQYRWARPQSVVFSCSVAEQLNRWYANNRFCGKCGGTMRHYELERAQICQNCARLVYPTIMPVVITAITDGNRLLLTKGRNQLSNNYGLVSGFVEIGEDLERSVRREIAEEVGLQVKNIRYYGSQPWPFSDTLLMGFFAELAGSPQITLQEEELAEGVWLEREEIPEQPLMLSLTAEMITCFRNHQEPRN